jgi:hypothetical protein
MIKSEEIITYFKAKKAYSTSQLKFSCFRMATSRIMIVGTKNGGIITYQLDPSVSAKILIDFQQPFKLPVNRIDCLNDCYNLLLFVDGSIYYYNTGKMKKKEIIRGAFTYEITTIGGKRFIFAAVKNEILKFNAEELFDNDRESKKDIHLIKKYTFDDTVRSCVTIGDHMVVALASKEVLFFDLQSLNSREANLLNTEDILIQSLATDEILVMMKYDRSNFIGVFLDEEGVTAKSRNSINLSPKDRVSRVASNSQFIVISALSEHFVYNLHDNHFLQMLDDPQLRHGAYFDFYEDSLFAVSENTVFTFSKMTAIEVLTEAKTRLISISGASLIKAISTEAGQAETQTIELYDHCAWNFLMKNRFDEALESFTSYNFDPSDVIRNVIEQYDINKKFEFISYPDQLKRFIKTLCLKKRGEVLREGDNAIIPGKTIKKKTGERADDVRASDWLALIDYAYVRACIELEEFNELFEFLRKTEKVYCDDRNSKISNLFRIIDNHKVHSEVSQSLIAELNLLLGNRHAALESLKNLGLAEKSKSRFDYNKYARKRAVDILALSQRDEKFAELVGEHFEWLATDSDIMQSFFIAVDMEGKIVTDILTQIDKLELEKARCLIKVQFLELQVKKTPSSNSAFIKGEYFLAKINLFRIGGDPNVLLSLDNFLKEENHDFDFSSVLPKFREVKSKMLIDSLKNTKIVALFLSIEIQLLKRVNTKESHHEAINMLIKIEEFSMAEDYCAGINAFSAFRHTQTKTTDSKDRIYLLNQLLEVYVRLYKEHKGKEKYIKLISDFLKKFAGNPNLDASNVINLLPEDLKVSDPKFDFIGFIDATFTKLNAQAKEMDFKKNVSEAYINTVSFDLCQRQKRWVRIDDESYCFKCGSKILQKVFDVYPNGVVVDHFCMSELKDKDYCPITHQNFKKTNLV